MGEVYKARDTRLDRTVAIKVLPEHVASDPDLRQRFEREAKTISSLNHPHICTLHDIGSQDGIDFLVMEYLEGDTLAQRLQKGALPLKQALQVAIEVADALDKAHRQGITHRDLKPGNIMLTKAGAKLLDFGLAKLRPPGTVGADGFSAATTRDEPLTGRGTILGTLQYMAPEQLEGKEADHRTDIFAFGAVLYEMVTGKRAFIASSHASLIAAILDRQPIPIATQQAVSPPALNHVVETCLAKQPDERWQTAGDIVRQLKWIVETESQASRIGSEPAASELPGSRRAIPWLVGAIAASIAVALGVSNLRNPEPTASREATRLTVRATRFLPQAPLALAPDGRTLVFAAHEDGVNRLYRRPLNEIEATPIPGPEDAYLPFFSPDGQWVGYFEKVTPRTALKKVLATGGPPVTVWDEATSSAGASWGPDDTIVVGGEQGRGLSRISAAGGEATPITTVDIADREIGHTLPEFLPGGEAVLFQVRFSGPDPPDHIAVASLETGEHRLLVEGGHPHYARGHVIFARDKSLWRVPFDVEHLQVTGEPFPVLEGVVEDPPGYSSFSLAADGSLAYIPGSRLMQGRRTLVWVDREGREEALGLVPNAYFWPRVSPEGTRVATMFQDNGFHVWIADLARGTLSRLTTDAGIPPPFPLWTPDGQRVVFGSTSEGRAGLFWRAADGTGPVERLVSIEGRLPAAGDWSADGKTLVFTYGRENARDTDIGLLDMAGDREWRPLLETEAYEMFPSISHDGTWIAYSSNQTGQFEIYVERFPDLGDRRQISPAGAFPGAVWSQERTELFYRRAIDGAMMRVAIGTEPTLTASSPEILFAGEPYYPSPEPLPVNSWDYDIAPDSERFLMLVPLKNRCNFSPV